MHSRRVAPNTTVSDARRRVAVAGVLLAALVALAPPAEAAHERADTHSLFVEGATLDLQQSPTFEGVAFSYDVHPPDIFDESCPGANFTLAEDRGSFTFTEQSLDTGCGEARLVLPLPPNARRLQLSFEANRVIEEQADLNSPVTFVQSFRILAPSGEIEFSRDYYDDTEGPQEPSPFHFDELLGNDVRDGLILSWVFDDLGFRGEGLTTSQRFQATVQNLTLSWPQIALPPPGAEQAPEQVDEDAGQATAQFSIRIEVPAFITSPYTRASAALVVRHGPTLLNISGPAGPIPASGSTETDDGKLLTSRLSNETLASNGGGTYTYLFETVRMLPPPPPPGSPSYIYPFYYILALLPLVAAVLALHQASLYVRQAEGTYRRTAWPVFVAVLLVVVYYLLLLGYSFFGLGPRRMSTLPLAREPLLIYVQFVLLLLMLAGSALAISRTLIGTMRRDLQDRRIKEEQLRRSNEELERFAYVASHDLQEPLRKVAGFTALLQKRYQGRLDRDADEIIQYAVDGATRMQMLIKDILAYSRVGSKELHRIPVDVNSTMTLVASDLGEQIKDEKAEVVWGELPTIRADASQLRQVLQNLVENALKYHHPKRRPKVAVAAFEDGPDWHFTVADNGQGIPDDKREEIFGIFRRLHGQDKPGTGIGLAVCKKAVERHGGRIWVESTPGKGSTFHFTLPRGSPEPGGRRGTAHPTDAGGPAPG
ncbi:MAG TPA: ATP-binding protein [Candidatus Thermoplasmatota archaeon]|nr:ATP-binding protein [Candidatus Thermoplasmatota archaeon]